MGRSISFLHAFPPKQNTHETSDEIIAQVELGSGDAWPCYFRPLMIAAYRKISESQMFPEDRKTQILISILDSCPPSHEETDNDAMRCGYFSHQRNRQADLMISIHRQKMLNERALFDPINQLNLHAAGVWSLVELVLMHDRVTITTPTIKRVSLMMESLKDFVPFEDKDIEETPYGNVDNCYNLADDRWIELFDAFKLAALAENVYAEIE